MYALDDINKVFLLMNHRPSFVVVNSNGENLQISDNYYNSTSSGSSAEKEKIKKECLKSYNQTLNKKEQKSQGFSMMSFLKNFSSSSVFESTNHHSKQKEEPSTKKNRMLGNYRTENTRNFSSSINGDITYDNICFSDEEEQVDYGHSKEKFNKNDWEAFFRSKVISFNSERFLFSLREGIPSQLRAYVWTSLAGIIRLKANYKDKYYTRLLLNSESKDENDIRKDLERTFFANDKSNVSHESLFRILKAYSLFDEKVGYCQGINFLALQLLSVIESEEDSFWVLIYIMRDKDWRSLFLPGTPKLVKLMIDLESIMKSSLTQLHNHFVNEGLTVDHFLGIFPSFFTTIFSYKVINTFSLRIWDLFFKFDSLAIIEVLVLLLRLNEAHLRSLTLDVS